MAKTIKLEKSESFISNKQQSSEKRRLKARAIASKFKGGDEPETNILSYQNSIIKVLNWYNINVELKDFRKYFNDYLINIGQKNLIQLANQVEDHKIKYLGILSRLKLREQYISDEHEQYITDKIKEISELYSRPKTANKIVKQDATSTKIDRTRELAIQYSEDIEGAIDEFVNTKKTDFNITGYLKSKEITSPVAKEIGAYYKTLLGELEQAQENLAEFGYGNWKKQQFKKFISFVQSLVDACNQQSVSAKVRKTYKKKPTSPTKLVSKLKYAKQNTELKLKSIKPESIIDSTELWVYNVKYRKLAVYKAEKNGKLSIKGCTVLGFDVKESIQVMLRKPDEFFKNTQLAKRALANGLKEIKTRPVTPNGRINEETILLGAWN